MKVEQHTYVSHLSASGTLSSEHDELRHNAYKSSGKLPYISQALLLRRGRLEAEGPVFRRCDSSAEDMVRGGSFDEGDTPGSTGYIVVGERFGTRVTDCSYHGAEPLRKLPSHTLFFNIWCPGEL